MSDLDTRTRVATALWHANAELRAKDQPTKQRHRTRFCDLIEEAPYPCTVLAEVVRRLGRTRALAIEIDPKIINASVRTPKIFAGRL